MTDQATPDKVATTVGTAREFAAELLTRAAVPAQHAGTSAAAIVLADVWGLASHGLMRLPYYLERLLAGGCQPDAELVTARDTGPLVALDGGGGLGHWQLSAAAELAGRRCARYGIAAASVADSSHCGALGVYLLPLLRLGLAGMVFSNGPAVMPPCGGSTPVVSTSPMAFGFPAGDGTAIVDLASSAVARGKVAQHARTGQPLPDGWALDAAGQPTTDPAAALRGMLAPLGGAKGFALAYAVEALTGGLVGPALAPDVVDMFAPDRADRRQGIAHLVIALDPDLISPGGDGRDRLADLAAAVRNAGGRVPGGRRVDLADLPTETALRIDANVAVELARWATRLGVPARLPAPDRRT